ncbi:MAG: DUF58 domain-containing protein [Verrucomicrobiota bacterium]
MVQSVESQKPAVLDSDHQFQTLQIRCRRAVEEVLAGEYLSVFKGRGIEFDEVRPYQPGDEVRTIDWNVTARTGEPFVKRFIEERDLTVYLIVDVSASEDYGSSEQTKREAAAELVGVLAHSAATNHDRVGLILFSDQVERHLPPAKGRVHVSQIVYETLTHVPSSSGTDLNEPLDMLMHIAKRRAVVFVISDFQTHGFFDAMQAAARAHDIVAVSVVDPHEVELPAAGLVRIKDAESGEMILVDSGDRDVRSSFAANARDERSELWQELDSAGVDQFSLWVGHDYVGALHGFLKERIQNRKGNHHG